MNFNLFDLFWIFIVFLSLQPLWQRRQVEFGRVQAIEDFERQRNSRTILLMHRQDSIRLLGIPLARYITIEDSEQVLRST